MQPLKFKKLETVKSFIKIKANKFQNKIYKIFEKIILNRLEDFLESKNVRDIEQYGYKKSLGTDDAVLKLCHDVSCYLDSGEYCMAIFMDLSSAFDTLNRRFIGKIFSTFTIGDKR